MTKEQLAKRLQLLEQGMNNILMEEKRAEMQLSAVRDQRLQQEGAMLVLQNLIAEMEKAPNGNTGTSK